LFPNKKLFIPFSITNGMAERGIPEHSIGRLFKQIEDIRVSRESKLELKTRLEAWAEAIALRALVYMNHAKRKTMLKQDVELAIKDIFSERDSH
jgi:histone H3/H4